MAISKPSHRAARGSLPLSWPNTTPVGGRQVRDKAYRTAQTRDRPLQHRSFQHRNPVRHHSRHSNPAQSEARRRQQVAKRAQRIADWKAARARKREQRRAERLAALGLTGKKLPLTYDIRFSQYRSRSTNQSCCLSCSRLCPSPTGSAPFLSHISLVAFPFSQHLCALTPAWHALTFMYFRSTSHNSANSAPTVSPIFIKFANKWHRKRHRLGAFPGRLERPHQSMHQVGRAKLQSIPI